MKKVLFTVLAILLLTTSSILAQPRIQVVGGDVCDWKNVSPKENPLKSKIRITNIGDETLKITEVKPTCGCTTAPLDKKTLAPGDTATMDVTLSISPRSGAVHKSIRVHSNDPKQGIKTIALRANVVASIDIFPDRSVRFKGLKVGTEATEKVRIKNNTDKKITLSDFEVRPEYVSINFTRNTDIEPGKEVELVVRVNPQAKGYFNCSIKMKTNDPDNPVLTIPGYGQVEESEIFTQ